MKLAIFLPNWVGDAVMATPTLRALRHGFPDAKIFGVMPPVIAETLRGLDVIDQVILHEARGKRTEHHDLAVIRRLRSERCDLGVLLPNSWRSAWIAWRGGIPRRVGFHRDGRGILLTDALRPKSRSVPHPVMDEYLQSRRNLGLRTRKRRPNWRYAMTIARALNAFWSRQMPGLRLRGVVCLNTGGAFGPAKSWPREYFADLACRIVDELQRTVLIVCGPAEREKARVIVREAGRPEVLSLADESLSIGLTKAAIRESRLLITTDSGPRHFAQPFGVPVITLFGPTHIAWSETHYDQAVHLNVPVPCGPCQQRECPLGHQRCMTELTPDRVFVAAKRVLTPRTLPLRVA